jgi:hypothetical protein
MKTCSKCGAQVKQVVWGNGNGGACWSCVKGC